MSYNVTHIVIILTNNREGEGLVEDPMTMSVQYNMGFEARLKEFCAVKGADLCGIAELKPFREGFTTLPGDLITPFLYAVSIAVRLDDDVIGTIADGPTPEYSVHCRETNARLDGITGELTQWIEDRGFHAQAIPASLWIDSDALLGNISHKAIARMAGLGWQGKSLLLVNKDYGPRLRLATVLTDMRLEPDGPVKNRCGKCTACTDACPAAAIKNVSTSSYYKNREEAIYLDRCYRKLLEFKEMEGIGYTFCGVCIQVCPFGRKKGKRAKTS